MATELRKTGISVVGDLPWGAHFCYFYETKQDLLDILIPYFKTGLENKEFCLWVISNSELLTVEEAESALRNALPDFDRYVAERSIEVVGHDDWFLSGHTFDPNQIASRFRKRLNEALARGYEGMRVNGSPAWLRNAGQKELRKFEAELDKLFPNERTIASCTYPLASIGAEEIFDVVRTHQFAIARRQGEWEIVETPELMQAKAETKRLNEELEQRVLERTNELKAANEELRKEIAERKQAEDELRQQTEILQQIFDHIPVMISFVDEEGHLKLVNREWEHTLGWSLEEIRRQNLDIFAECYPDPQYRQQVLNFVAEAEGEWTEFKTRVRDGRVIDTTFVRVQLSDGTKIGIGKDITKRKQAEEALDERLRFETLVTELSAAFANLSTNEVDREIDKWLQTLAEFLGVDRASFFQFEEDWMTLYRSHSYTVPGIEPLPPAPLGMKDQFPWITDQLRQGITVKWSRIPDDMPDEAVKEKEYAARLGVKSGLNIPVRMGGSVICAITFTSIVAYRDWPDTMVARLRLVGEIFAAAVQRKRSEAALQAKEQEFRAIVENAPDQIIRYDRDLRRSYVNPAVAQAYGLPAEALTGKPIGSVVHDAGLDVKEDEVVQFRQRIAAVFDTGKSYEFENDWPMPTGRRHYSIRLFPELDLNGSIVNVMAIARDITERRIAEEELKKEKEILEKIFENIPVMIGFVGDDGAVKLVNPEWERTIGWTLKELQEQNVDIFAEAYPDPSYRQEILDFVAAATGEWADLRIKVRDGRVIDAACAVVHLSDGTKIAIAQDITERKQAEEKVRQSERQLAEAQRLAHIGSWDWDLRTNAVTWSDELYHIFGLQPGTISVAEEVDRFIHPDDLDLGWDTVKRAVASKEPYDYYHRILRPDGTQRIARSRGSIMSDERGEPIRIFGATQDVTELKRAEEQLKTTTEQLRALSARFQSAREEEGTRIAREIHDELGSALTSLKWDLEGMEKALSEPKSGSELASMKAKALTMTRLVDGTIDVVRRISAELRPGVLDDLGLVPAIEWQARQFHDRTGIAVHCDCTPDDVDLNQEQSTAVFRILQEALTNVLRHAQATRVDIKASEEGGEVVLTISDNGKGITEDEMSGPQSLGLLGMRERAILIGGKIDIAGVPGKGTVITLRVPIGRAGRTFGAGK